MPGIFLGSTPINMGAPVQEVYVGSVKVWPSAPASKWVERVGQQASGQGYRSNLGISVANQGSNVLRYTFPVSTFGGQAGTRQTTNGYVNTGVAVRNVSATQWDVRPFQGTASIASDRGFIKTQVALSDGDPIDSAYFRFSAQGVMSFTTEPALTVTPAGTGIYVITLPPGKRLATPAAVIMTPQGTGFVIPNISQVNNPTSLDSFTIEVRNTSNVVVGTSLAVYIAMIPL